VAGLIAGFDAGQTHTTCRLARAEPGLGGRIDSVVVAEGRGPGVSHLAASGGPQRFQAALIQSLGHARAILAPGDWGDGSLPLWAAAIGASGIEQGSGVQSQGQALACSALNLPLERVVVTGDERTALVGAFADGAGIVVISGTGTIAVGRNASGQEHRCAGWGWLLDGGGSAMDIGQDGLRLKPSQTQAAQGLKALVVAPEFGPAGFARLAPLVAALASSGDADALAILCRNGKVLAAMAAAVAAALDLAAPAVCPMGGALEHLPAFRAAFRSALTTALPGCRWTEAAGDACAGALALAKELL
jgi:phenylacetic acid degradation operon negative regulatory protein